MTDATRAKWTRRVDEWRASGEDATEFAKREGDFTGGTLRYWASRLKHEPPGVTRRSLIRPVVFCFADALGG